jgi:serine-type D-Ala-D-Ala carboxypeptidase (penicillin-binding protein 5/6)
VTRRRAGRRAAVILAAALPLLVAVPGARGQTGRDSTADPEAAVGPVPGEGQAQSAAAPSLLADSAILVEPSTGDVVFARSPNRRLQIASTTKIMTTLVVLERLRLDDVLAHRGYRATFPDESLLNLRRGERMSVRDLLRGLLLASGNDAAMTLARGAAGSPAAFVPLMNRRARELGLTRTHFSNPIGLDARGNYSTAADLIRLTREVFARSNFFRRTVDLPSARLESSRGGLRVGNRNTLVRRVAFVNGVKTGHTPAAGYVLVGSGTRGGVTMMSAVLGDPSEAARNADTLALLRYGLARYRLRPVLRSGQVVATAKVKHREEERIDLIPERPYSLVVRRGEPRPTYTIQRPDTLTGPIRTGTRVGLVTVRYRGRVTARIPLVTAAPVPRVGMVERAADAIFGPGTLVVIAALAVLVAMGVRRERRRRERRRRSARNVRSTVA